MKSALFNCRTWDGYLIPQRDAFLEPLSFTARQPIKALSGFTGSCGTLLLTPSMTYLFVDGRYVLQAQQQCPHLTVVAHTTPLEWITTHFKKGQTLALPAWRMTVKEAELYGKLDLQLLWDFAEEEPPLPSSIEVLPEEVSFQEKCLQVFGPHLEGAVLLCKSEDIAWLTNLRGQDLPYTPVFQAYGCVFQEKGKFFIKIFTAACPVSHQEAYEFYPLNAWPHQWPNGPILYDPRWTPQGFLGHKKSFDFQPFSLHPLAEVRSQKTSQELHHLTQVHQWDGIAVTRFLYWLTHERSPEETEFSAACHLEKLREDHRPFYRIPSFPTISAFGAHSAIIHYIPSKESALQLGEGLYLVDSGGQYHWGTTDITRTIWLGDSAPPLRLQALYTRVLQAHIQLASAIFPSGTQGRYLDWLARSVMWQEGLDYAHSTGHGVGLYLSVHEWPPHLSLKSTDVIQKDMVFSNEPGYYEQGLGGIRLENVVKVESLKADQFRLETLSLAPFDRRMILMEELSGDQKRWLNAYHARVYEILSPFLTEPVRQWLKDQTAPL